MKKLILGGVKSGKSYFAEQRVKAWEKTHVGGVVYIATAEPHDAEFAKRIAKHQAQRPDHWQTLEEPLQISEVIERLSGQGQCILLECLTLWMSNLLAEEASLSTRVDQFCTTVENYQGELIIVSNETGLGMMPSNALARRFGDEIGVLHQRLAAMSDEVVMLVAGLPHFLKP